MFQLTNPGPTSPILIPVPTRDYDPQGQLIKAGTAQRPNYRDIAWPVGDGGPKAPTTNKRPGETWTENELSDFQKRCVMVYGLRVKEVASTELNPVEAKVEEKTEEKALPSTNVQGSGSGLKPAPRK